MTSVDVLTVLLLIAATAACVALIWLTREAVATARSMRELSDDIRERLVPLLDKADVTVDAANAELLRIDGAITRFEEASARVSAASNTLADVVQAPADIVTGVADRVRRAWKDRREHAASETGAASDVTDVGSEQDVAAETDEARPQDSQPAGVQSEWSTEDAADSQPSDGD